MTAGTIEFIATDLWALILVALAYTRRIPARVLYPLITGWLAVGLTAARLTGAV